MIRTIITSALLLVEPNTRGPVQLLEALLGTGPGNLCAPGRAGEKAFSSLFAASGRFHPTLKTTRRRLSASSVETKEHASFTKIVRWNGFRVLAAEKRHVANAESEGMTERVLVVGAPPKALQRMLRDHGQAVPLAPGYLRVEVEPGGGAASIAPRAGGAALRCAWDA